MMCLIFTVGLWPAKCLCWHSCQRLLSSIFSYDQIEANCHDNFFSDRSYAKWVNYQIHRSHHFIPVSFLKFPIMLFSKEAKKMKHLLWACLDFYGHGTGRRGGRDTMFSSIILPSLSLLTPPHDPRGISLYASFLHCLRSTFKLIAVSEYRRWFQRGKKE